MDRLVKIVLAIVILIALPKIIQKIMLGDRKPDVSAQMTDLVRETNKSLPKKIDAVTTLTKAEFDGGTYRINYSMDPTVRFDPSQQDTYRNFAVKQICGSNMKMILDNNVTVEYHYTFHADVSTDQTMTLSIPPSSCR